MKRFYLFLFAISCLSNLNAQTWSSGVGQLFQQNCVQCHHTGGIAPFSLETYADVLPYLSAVESSVASDEMPPWTPDPNYKSFAHQRVMSTNDKNSILDWINNGAPEGNVQQAPSIPLFQMGTQLNGVDLTLTIPQHTVGSPTDEYINFELASNLPQAMYANAVEVLPGNLEAVHHVLIFQDSTNNPIDPTSMGGTGSPASKLIYAYTPGARPYFAPPGTGFRLPANTRIIMQVHYAPGSMGQTDQTTVNFKLTSGPTREIFVEPVLNHNNITNGPLFIPANQVETFNQHYTIQGNATLLYVFPHMHLIGSSIKSWANLPVTNDTVRLVDIPEWDFHWQDNFIFPNAVVLPFGSTIRSEAVYDNTTNNPENPSNPPQDVSVGEGTQDEMMYVFFAYLPYQSGDEYIIVDDRINVKGATNLCFGQSVLLEAIAGIGYTYQWYMDGNAIPGAINSSYTANVAGDYTVQIGLGPNSILSEPVTVTMGSAPSTSIVTPTSTHISLGSSIILEATTGTHYLYQWYQDGTPIQGANDLTYEATANGSYFVTVYDDCFAVSDTVILTAEASLFEMATQNFVLYPNPADDKITLIQNQSNQLDYQILDIAGNTFSKGVISISSSELDVTELSSGVYFIEIQNRNSGESVAIKFIKN